MLLAGWKVPSPLPTSTLTPEALAVTMSRSPSRRGPSAGRSRAGEHPPSRLGLTGLFFGNTSPDPEPGRLPCQGKLRRIGLRKRQSPPRFVAGEVALQPFCGGEGSDGWDAG